MIKKVELYQCQDCESIDIAVCDRCGTPYCASCHPSNHNNILDVGICKDCDSDVELDYRKSICRIWENATNTYSDCIKKTHVVLQELREKYGKNNTRN